MDITTVQQPLQYVNIIVKAMKNQPSLSMVNEVVIPVNTFMRLSQDLVTIAKARDIIKAQKLGISLNIELRNVHVSNLINLN